MTIPVCFVLPILLLVPSLSTAKNAGTANINNTGDCDNLLQFGNSFNASKFATWKNGTDCCSWDGVTCHVATNQVIGLDLSFSLLVGPLESNSPLFSLRNLQQLNLAGNDFEGSPISPRFGNFTRMTHLNLSNSAFSGPIPLESISRLPELIILDLYSRSDVHILTVEDHSFDWLLRNLTRLRELKLDYVDMSKMSPISLSNLSSTLTSLSLSSCNLQGTFPSNLFFLPNLRSLLLSDNRKLTGTLPDKNWTCPLVSLDLSDTMFDGSIPAWLGNMVHMNHLDLSNSRFSGIVDFEMFANLRNLRYLSLGRCNLSVLVRSGGSYSFPGLQVLDLSECKLTEFPYFLSSLDALSSLDLSRNMISGRIPEWFHTDKLKDLNLSFNEFTGDILSSICRASSLEVLSLTNNGLTGTIPECFGNLSQLLSLFLTDNRLQGPLPRSLSNCTSLADFHVGQNRIHDTFPHWLINSNTIANMIEIDLRSNMFHGVIDTPISRGLLYLNLAGNNFSGQLPANFMPNYSSIEVIDMGSNNFDGPLPTPPPTINYYIVSKNKFDGAIPQQLCSATFLSILNLSGNRLTGNIPPCFSDLLGAYLSVLDLQANKLYGQIPEMFFPRLQTPRLSQNRLVGSLPRSLDRCENLEVLDLSENELEGDFPYWLDTLPNLQVLVLRSNKFHGPVNSSSRTGHVFPKLRIFDIAKNGIRGPLPAEYLANLVAMKNEETGGLKYIGNYAYYHDSIVVGMKGSEMELEKILIIFTTIDFSSNYFQGEIPEVIGDLKALKGLNFSHNNLSGSIPSSFGNLTNLEWPDLSSNNLDGKIPRELADLKMLSWLNLSDNHLTGPIPHSTQFDTFNNSFDGNPGLCGRPLPKLCENDAAPSTPSHDDEEEETESDSIRIEWRAVPIGYVCGIVFGISATYLMLEIGRPRWLVRMVHRKINSLRTNMPRRNVASRNHARRRAGGR